MWNSKTERKKWNEQQNKNTQQMMNNSLKAYGFAVAIRLIKFVEHGRFGKVHEVSGTWIRQKEEKKLTHTHTYESSAQTIRRMGEAAINIFWNINRNRNSKIKKNTPQQLDYSLRDFTQKANVNYTHGTRSVLVFRDCFDFMLCCRFSISIFFHIPHLERRT